MLSHLKQKAIPINGEHLAWEEKKQATRALAFNYLNPQI